VIDHPWGKEIIIKQTESCLIRMLKIKAGGHLCLSLEPETTYLQTGSILCLETGEISEEGVGDLSACGTGPLNFVAVSPVTLYETRYFTSKK
jgi:hypothetical protein